MKRALLLILISAIAVVLTTCSEPIDFVDSVATEVKVANDLFLTIGTVSPGENLTGIDPGADITIQFDRNINLDSINSAAIKILDPVQAEQSWSIQDFEDNTNTLTIETEGLKIQTKYVIVITNLRGEDGSELQESYIWSFTTGLAPAGNLYLTSQNINSLAGYTDDSTVDISITGNDVAEYYAISNNESDFSDPTSGGIVWNPLSSGTAAVNSYSLTGSAGENSVWVLFRFFNTTSSQYVYSQPKSDEIVLDLSNPTVNLGSDRYENDAYVYITPQTVSDNYEIQSYSWTCPAAQYGNTPDFGTYTDDSTTRIYTTTDDRYTVRLTIMDKSGRTAYDDMYFFKDTVAPTETSALLASGAAYTTSNTVDFAVAFSDDRTSAAECKYRLYVDGTWVMSSYVAVGASSISEDVTFIDYDYSNRRAGVYILDAAGNYSSFMDDYIYVDTVAPNPPTITTSTTVTGSNSLTWAWTSGGGGGGYQYHLYGASDTTTSGTSFNYTASATIGREYRLYVQERDPAGNWSSADSHDIAYFPGGTYISPDHAAITVSRTTDVDWPSFYEINGSLVDGYYFYVWTGSTTMPKGTAYIDVSSSGYNNTVTLPGNTRFYWCYKPYSTFLTTKTVIAQSPTYYFTTALF